MRPIARHACFVTVLGLALLLVVPLVAAEEIAFDVAATDGRNQYWFQVEGYSGTNPTLQLASGDEVTVNIINAGTQPHNIHFGSPIGEGSRYLAPGEQANFTFRVPGGLEAQETQYWCDPHRQLGMVGTLLLAGANTTGQGAVETPQNTVPLVNVAGSVAGVLVAASLAGLWRRGT